jgi:2-dehydropantoate 2-reductase
LAQAGEKIIFVARGENLRVMRSSGLRVESIAGDFDIWPVQATDDPAGLGTVDVILVAVKAWQVHEAAEAMRSMVGKHTIVVPLQNGVDAPYELALVLGKQPVLGGLCRIASSLVAPGQIRHTAIQPQIEFGELEGGFSPRAESLRKAFERAGVEVKIPSDIRAAMWAKFLFIAALSGVCAVTRMPVGTVRSLAETRTLLQAAMLEIEAVARAIPIALPDDIVPRTMAFIDELPGDTTPSMQRDILDGRPSELEYQSGAVVRFGAAHRIPTPVNEFIYRSLVPQERQSRGVPLR